LFFISSSELCSFFLDIYIYSSVVFHLWFHFVLLFSGELYSPFVFCIRLRMFMFHLYHHLHFHIIPPPAVLFFLFVFVFILVFDLISLLWIELLLFLALGFFCSLAGGVLRLCLRWRLLRRFNWRNRKPLQYPRTKDRVMKQTSSFLSSLLRRYDYPDRTGYGILASSEKCFIRIWSPGMC
jgi:hypothetical protein